MDKKEAKGGVDDELLGVAVPRMSTQANKLGSPPVLISLYAVLLVICSLLSCSDAESCNFFDSGEQRWGNGNHTTSCTFEQMDGDLYLTSPGTAYLTGNLGSYMNNNSSLAFNSSDTGLFIIPYSVILWDSSFSFLDMPHEASFSVTITLTAYRTQSNNSSRLIFAVLPRVPYGENGSMSLPLNGSLRKSIPTSNRIVGSHVSVQIGTSKSNRMGRTENRFIWVEISIDQVDNSATDNYTVWIDYNSTRSHISVYVDDVETVKPKPTSPVADIPLIISDIMGQVGFFGLSSSMGQLLQLHTWSSTVEHLQLPLTGCPTSGPSGALPKSYSRSSPVAILLFVLVSAAVTAIMVSIVYCYFKSKYRRWKKDLGKLAKSMQRLPGMPIHVKFTDIRKATNDFHETTVLGRGTYGVVYKCRLPTLEDGGVMQEVAVKMFTRDDSRRYEDFLTEVSVISRLRHKNIVSLVGWSYNRGRTILIYEYMPNGSLDQHLFHQSSDGQQELTPICEWHTRYNIVKDVATGLRYIHDEYEPLVLHRDIKASNILIDSSFHGRLGDFGIACVVDNGKNSYTESGARGTFGFMAPEYVYSGQATRETDIFAFGVLILEIVTGKPPVSSLRVHITDWVWKSHREGKLHDTVDPVLTISREYDPSDATRLLLLGLACTSPNPSNRPNMIEALQVITKLVVPPEVPLEKPRFVWSQLEERSSPSSDHTTSTSNLGQSSAQTVEIVDTEQAPSPDHRTLHDHPREGPSQECISVYHTANATRSD